MQIQPSNNVLNAASLKPACEPGEPKAAPSAAVVNELGQAFAAAVQTALQSCQTDPSAVRQAQADIAQGRLETPEAYDAAAENLLTFGI